MIYSKRLAVKNGATSGANDLFTVPAGHIYVVKYMTFIETGGAVMSGYIEIKSVCRLRNFSVAANQSDQWENLRWVLEAGDVLRIYTAAGTPRVTVHGYDLAA